MTVIVSSRHMDVSAALRSYGEQKVGKLTRYYDRIQEIEIVFDAAKDAISVEIMVHAEHRNMFIGRHSGSDAYACVDGCIDKLERQLTDHKERVRNRKHSGPDARRELDNLGEAV